jgi:hypothetical protein
MSRVFKPAARAAGIPELTFHDLRHTGAPLMIAAASFALGEDAVGLALDDVVDLEVLRGSRALNPDFGEYRRKALPERLELLLRVPDLAYSEVAVRAEADVVVEALGREGSLVLEHADSPFVHLDRHSRGGEANDDAHGRPSVSESGRPIRPHIARDHKPSRPAVE